MENRISKEAIFATCVKKQEELIDNFTNKIEEMKKELFAHDSIPSQEDHFPAERVEVLDTMERELQFLHYEMNILRNLDWENEKQQVDQGAVVVTDKRTFFICVSIEEVVVEGEKVFGLSVQAPIYVEMQHKKAGDSFEFNGISYQIKAVY